MKYTKEELRMHMLAGIITEDSLKNQLKDIDNNLSSSNKKHAIFQYNLGPKVGSSTKTAYIYKDNPKYIIKDFDKDYYNTGIELEYELSEKYPKFFAHILKFDIENNIMIQEKLDSSSVDKDIKYFQSKYGIDLLEFSNDAIDGNMEGEGYSLEDYENEINNSSDFQKFKKYWDFYLNLNIIFDKENLPEYNRIAHMGNIGFDSKGNIKVFDLD